MSTDLFDVREHVIPCAHIREYRNGVRDETVALRLAVKEYRPLNNLDPRPGSLTIIATTPNAFPKECFEPLWDDIVRTSEVPNIRGIWVADACYNGASGVLNEQLLGDDPSWFDHSRDLLNMVNHFRERMIRPIFGIGCCRGAAEMFASFGSVTSPVLMCKSVQLSLLHPRLFHTLALFEPIIQDDVPQGPNAALPSSLRPDFWPSREKAAASFRRNKMFAAWDPRVLDIFIEHGLRKIPTPLYPIDTEGEEGTSISREKKDSVTLTTTKHQEAWSYLRNNFTPRPLGDPSLDEQERLLSPDLDPSLQGIRLFHRAEVVLTNAHLPELRPRVLWIFGERSPINSEALQLEKMMRTGVGPGGSGGIRLGKVEKVTVPKTAHLVMFEKVGSSAAILVDWMQKQLRIFEENENFYCQWQSGKSKNGMLIMSDRWLKEVRQKRDAERPVKEKL